MLAGCVGQHVRTIQLQQISKPLPKLTNRERVIVSVLHLTTRRIQIQDSLQVPLLRSRRGFVEYFRGTAARISVPGDWLPSEAV